MYDVIFIGGRRDALACRDAGIPSYAPAPGLLAERVMAEKRRCRVMAMTEEMFAALPVPLARELREGSWPQITIIPEPPAGSDAARVRELIRYCRTAAAEAPA